MVERQRGRRNILQTLNDSELIKNYRLDHAGIMIIVDLIRDTLTSPNQCNTVIMPEMKVILRYLVTGKNWNMLEAGKKRIYIPTNNTGYID